MQSEGDKVEHQQGMGTKERGNISLSPARSELAIQGNALGKANRKARTRRARGPEMKTLERLSNK